MWPFCEFQMKKKDANHLFKQDLNRFHFKDSDHPLNGGISESERPTRRTRSSDQMRRNSSPINGTPPKQVWKLNHPFRPPVAPGTFPWYQHWDAMVIFKHCWEAAKD